MDFAAAVEKLARGSGAATNDARAPTLSEEELERALEKVRSRKQAAPSPVESLLREAEELAAVSGRFDPRDLFDETVDEETLQTVLSRLAPQCVIEPFEGAVRWLLANDARTAVLNRIIDEGRLKQLLDRSKPAVTDMLGQLLRELLRDGAGVRLDGRTHNELLCLLCAVEATSGVDIQKPDEQTLNALIKSAKFLSDYDVLLDKGFYGREKQRSELKRFVTEPAAGRGRWKGIVLTGLGGAGKSTLAVRVAREVADEQKATVVILDFDRPGIDPRDLYWLEAELTRQVGHQYPETEQALRALREDARRQLSESGAEDPQAYTSEGVEEERSLRRTVTGLADALRAAGAGERPFMLVLDTFEEVAQRDLTGRILEWLFEISRRLAPAPLRVVFSGRLYYEGLAKVTQVGVTQTLELEEMEPEEAEALLTGLGLSRTAASRLANSEVLPRRPLEMRLLAKLVTGGDESAVAELEEEIRNGGDAARELFAGLIYRRVLRRIENETARELAYPGLVLRYVTVELIQKVLVPVLGLPLLSKDDAQRALDALASYGWLAYRRPKDKPDSKDEVYHRKDLRRLMLKAMIAQESEKTRQINQATVAFFSSSDDERERAESVYHRLMLVAEPKDGVGFQEAELRAANPYIGADIVDLPTAAAVLLKYVSTGEVAVSEVTLLPPGLRGTAYLAKGERLVASREFGAALELYARRPAMPQALTPSGKSFIPHKEWEVDLLFATAAWDALKRPEDFWAVVNDVPLFPQLLNILFPSEVVGFVVQPSLAREFLVEFRDWPTPFIDVESERRDLTIQRLAVCLLLLHDRIKLAPEELEAAGRLTEAYRHTKQKVTPIIERRLLFLNLLRAQADPANDALSQLNMAPAMFKLELQWLAKLPALLIPTHDDTILSEVAAEVAGVMIKSVGWQPTGGVRDLLGGVDAFARSGQYERGIPIVFDKRAVKTGVRARELVELFRGPDPEFRDPCRYALLEAFPDRDSHLRLASLLSSVVGLKLIDLQPWAFGQELAADPEHALESYVELVDRCWALGKLLRAARKVRPDAPKLAVIDDAYQRWDRAARATLLKSFGSILRERS